eukprot:COSAG02_NODE_24595_length_683_cov_0.982877_2_plen_56_part_00
MLAAPIRLLCPLGSTGEPHYEVAEALPVQLHGNKFTAATQSFYGDSVPKIHSGAF